MVYDLIVIGGGPAGYLAAERAGEGGLSVLLIEKRFIGGVCLNEGCVPSKALLYSAKLYHGAADGAKYGITVKDIKLDHKAVIERKKKVVNTLVTGIKSKLRKLKVTVVMAEAKITGKSSEGFTVAAGGETYTGSKLLIATGSVPVTPPIPGVKEGLASGFVATNREILDWETVPEKLVIIGGGVIGLEMASYYNTAGSKVTVVEMLDKIAGPTDREISEILKANYEKAGIVFKLGCKVTGVTDGKVLYEEAGKQCEVAADKVLLSIGRRAFTEGLGLETIGVETERGKIKTDDTGLTNIAGVYATGDVNGVLMLAHTAYRETEVAVNNILGKKDHMRYNSIPSVIYTNPEVACVGENEETAKAKGIDFDVVKLSMMYSGRYVAENEGGDGIIKILINKKYKNVIGVHMIGNYSSEIIYGAAMMVETEMRVDDIKQIVFPHPSVSEIIREGIFEYKG